MPCSLSNRLMFSACSVWTLWLITRFIVVYTKRNRRDHHWSSSSACLSAFVTRSGPTPTTPLHSSRSVHSVWSAKFCFLSDGHFKKESFQQGRPWWGSVESCGCSCSAVMRYNSEWMCPVTAVVTIPTLSRCVCVRRGRQRSWAGGLRSSQCSHSQQVPERLSDGEKVRKLTRRYIFFIWQKSIHNRLYLLSKVLGHVGWKGRAKQDKDTFLFFLHIPLCHTGI